MRSTRASAATWSRRGPRASATSGLITLLAIACVAPPAAAAGVGGATWTPSSSSTRAETSRFLVERDAITFVTEARWSRDQLDGLRRYLDQDLRYTIEVNDRSGRLSGTGYWATNHPDPAFDLDDDDGDGRWEEAEVTAGAQAPVPGTTYTTLVQLSRWHAKRERGECTWAWDRRRGGAEVLSQLSRELLGEWQAERYTLAYEREPYERVGRRPTLPADAPAARCREPRPGPAQSGILVTFAEPVAWDDFSAFQADRAGHWTAWEAIGSSQRDDLVWTCGGPSLERLALEPCRTLGVSPDGVSAAIGYFTGGAIDAMRARPEVARVDALQDAVTSLLFDVGGFGVERPGLAINDEYWDRFLAD